MRWLIGFFLMLNLLATASCGFHLRGSTAGLSAGDIVVHGVEASHPLALALTGQNGQTKPRFDVQIERETWDRRVSAFGSDGRAVEYELKYDVSFKLRDIAIDRNGPQDSVRILRFYGFDPAQALAKSAEETSLRAEMIREAATAIKRRTAAWARTL